MKEKKPKITVITATFNLIKDGRKDFFCQCVESVHNQTYPNIEHIVIDGASTDGSLDLIRKYEKKGWLKCYSEPDNGMHEGMNKGLKKATGKYIIFLNSDDFYHSKDILEKAVQKLEESGADYLYGDYLITDRDGSGLSEINVTSPEYIFKQMTWKHEALIVRKDIYEKIGGYKERFKEAIDCALNIELVLSDCSFVYLNENMFTCRMGGKTTVTRYKIAPDVMERVVEAFLFYYKKACPSLTKADMLNILFNGIYPKAYLRSISDYFVKKNLKNFNYSYFFYLLKDMEHSIFDTSLQIRNKKYFYLFNFFPLIKSYKKGNITRFYLFNFIPIFKIKTK